MNIRFKTTLAAAAVAAFGFTAPAAFAGFIPTGVQVNVAQTTVQNTWGWTECFSTAGNSSGTSLSGILSGCTGDYLMLATYQTGQSNYDVLAAAEFGDVTFDTGVQSSNGSNVDTTHTANGSEWYFSNSWSWGFTELGNVVRLSSCDLALRASFENNIGMCWHTGGGNLNNGYAFNDGTMQSLSNSNFNRVVLTMNAMQMPEPGTLAILGLGLVGLGLARRKRAA